MTKKLFLITKFIYFNVVDIKYKNKVKKLDFTFLKNKVFEKGHNIGIPVMGSDKTEWFIKFCRNTKGRVPDICEREELTYLFGRIFGLPIIRAVVLNNPEKAIKNTLSLGDDIVKNKCVLLPFIQGSNLKSFFDQSIKKLEILKHHQESWKNILAFYHWIGEEDRGLTDVMIDNDKIIFIDHGLSGPGHSNRLRSVHPYPEKFKPDDIIRKCFPGKKSLVDFIFKDLGINPKDLYNLPIINFIEALPEYIISSYVNSLPLIDSNGNDFRKKYKYVLIKRQKNLRKDFQDWIMLYEKM